MLSEVVLARAHCMDEDYSSYHRDNKKAYGNFNTQSNIIHVDIKVA